MLLSDERVRKIRKLSLDEIRVRASQRFAIMKERLKSGDATEISDDELLSEFYPSWLGDNAADTLGHCLQTKSRFFLPWLQDREKVVETMVSRYPNECAAIINTAEVNLSGKFSLLGHTELNFADSPHSPIDWNLDPVSAKRAPLSHWSKLHPLNPLDGGDPKVVWELNRHAHLVTLGQAYWLTGEDRFAAAFTSHISSWIISNPIGMGINWASSLEVAFRSIAWLWALGLCADSSEVTTYFLSRILKSLIAHGRHIERYLSYYFSPNTHLTGEALGLLYLGIALPELRRAEGWRKLGLKILIDQSSKQIQEDGVHFEQSSYYHRYTADFFIHLLALARSGDRVLGRKNSTLIHRKLSGLLDYLMWITRPDGSSPLIGDDDGGRVIKLASRPANDFRDTLAIGAALLNRGDYKFVAGAAPAELLWMTGAGGLNFYDSLRPEKPSEIHREFKSSGYFVMRNGWSSDSSFVLIDCGPHGAGHAHSDALSIEFASHGVTWLVDPGSYIYAADAKARDIFRSTSAHNTVMVDDRPQSIPSEPFSWRTSAKCQMHEFAEQNGGIFFQGSHYGYQSLRDPVTHTRSVIYFKANPIDNQPERLIVRDRFTAKKHHRYFIRFHFAPTCEASIAMGAEDDARSDGCCVEARHENGARMTIKVACETNIEPETIVSVTPGVALGMVSTCYGRYSTAPVAVFEAEGVGTQEFVTQIECREPEAN